MERETAEMIKMTVQTVLVTVASFCAVVVFIILLLSFTAPVAMAKLSGSLGLYGSGAWYSSLQYSYSGDVAYISDAFNYSIMAKDNQAVIENGEKLIKAEGFEEFCQEKDVNSTNVEGYKQYVYGRLSVAYYDTENKQKALDTAMTAVQTEFKRHNAVADLLYRVVYEKKDKEFAQTVLNEIAQKQYDEDEYKQNVILLTGSILSVLNTLP